MSKSITRIDELKGSLLKMESQFKVALPKHISPEKFIRVVQTAVSTSKGLVECDRTSLYAACMRAAQAGLLPDGREAAIVSYGGQASFQPMVDGIMKLVRNSGELASMTSEVVYAGDDFDYWVDTDGPHLKHKPKMFGNRGDKIGVYALAKTKDGAVYIEILSKQQVMDIKNSSPSKNGPWQGPFEGEMWRKSAIKRLGKRLPKSTDIDLDIPDRLDTALRSDDDYNIEKTAAPVKKQRAATPVADETPVGSISETIDVEAKPKGNTSKKSRLDKAMETQTSGDDEAYSPEQHFDDASGEFGEAPI